MKVLKWMGRVTWWLLAWPIGLVLSIRHGSKRRHQKLIEAINSRPTFPVPPPPPPVW